MAEIEGDRSIDHLLFILFAGHRRRPTTITTHAHHQNKIRKPITGLRADHSLMHSFIAKYRTQVVRRRGPQKPKKNNKTTPLARSTDPKKIRRRCGKDEEPARSTFPTLRARPSSWGRICLHKTARSFFLVLVSSSVTESSSTAHYSGPGGENDGSRYKLPAKPRVTFARFFCSRTN